MARCAGIILASVLLSGVAAPSFAQDFPSLGYMGTTIGAGGLQTAAMNSVIQQSVGSRTYAQTGSVRGLGSSLGSGAQQAGRPIATTTYTSSRAVTARVQEQYADFLSKSINKQAGEQVRRILSRENFVSSWSNNVRGQGLKPGDVADALTAYWLLNWAMANNSDGSGITNTQVAAVKRQVVDKMRSNAAYARLSNEQRQEMAEVLMLNFSMQLSGYNIAKQRGDRGLLQKVSAAAVTRFKNEMGVNLQELRITNVGFVKP